MSRVQGHFGSAGGSRSMRHTATRAGVGQTATVAGLAMVNQLLPARLDDPSDDDIRQGIADQQCPWCDDPRTFRALSVHLSKGHGIDVRALRERLGLLKNARLISVEEHERRARIPHSEEHLKKLHDARGWASPRKLSSRAKAIQGEKARKAKFTQYGPLGRQSRVCVVCGQTFIGRYSRRATCSKRCFDTLISQQLKAVDHAWTRGPHPERRIYKPCKWCGAQFYGARGTCSTACAKASQSAGARRAALARDPATRLIGPRPSRRPLETLSPNGRKSRARADAKFAARQQEGDILYIRMAPDERGVRA